MEDKNDQEIQIPQASGYLVAAGLTFIVFWVTNILKESYPAIKSFLEFYKPIGPLLGVFAVSLVAFFIFSALFQLIKVKNQSFAFWFFAISAIIFALMVFPPIFGPIAHALGGE